MKLANLTVGLTARSDLPGRDEHILHVARVIKKTGATLMLDGKRCKMDELKKTDCYKKISELDFLVVLGGDGTILRTIRETDTYDVPIIPVNKGTIGFLSEIAFTETDNLLPKLLGGEGVIDERMLLHVVVRRGKKEQWSGYILNDAVISQGAIARLIDLKAFINQKELTTYHADGVIISSPTGSTAYSLSAGGPIVHPKMDAMIITPINPHSFSQKPIVVPGEFHVTLEILSRQNKYGDLEISLTLDGQTYVSLQGGDTVDVSFDGTMAKFIRRDTDSFFHKLKKKLKWGERLED